MPGTTPVETERRFGNSGQRRYEVLVIAASTGGPAALGAVLGGLDADFDLPILIVQHMMPAFTSEFTEWLANSVALTVDVARHGAKLHPGHAYLAPKDVHLKLLDRHTVGLSDTEKHGYHRPSANVLFESAAECFGSKTLAVVLTGMGNDGIEGLTKLHSAGGHILVQDEESCVVFGMPGAAVSAGLAHSVVALEDMAARVQFLARQRIPQPNAQSHKETSDSR